MIFSFFSITFSKGIFPRLIPPFTTQSRALLSLEKMAFENIHADRNGESGGDQHLSPLPTIFSYPLKNLSYVFNDI